MSDSEEEEEGTSKISVKVVLVGESGVGKTSIINRLINNEFSLDRAITIGGNYTSKKINLPKYNKKNRFRNLGHSRTRKLSKFY